MNNPFRHRKLLGKAPFPFLDPNWKEPSPNAFGGYKEYDRAGAAEQANEAIRNILNPEVVSDPLLPHNGGMNKEGETVKSYRVAMAQALLTELAEAYQRHGDTDGTRRLRLMVSRMVAELLV